MKLIPLNHGKFAHVDDEDFEYLSQFKWQARMGRHTYYAVHTFKIDGRRVTIPMHRVILKLNDPSIHTDHRDHDGLNNTKDNLRVATPEQNAMNKGRREENTTGYAGVRKHARKWRAYLNHGGKQVHIGLFGSAVEAARARDAKAVELRGEFACLNFPSPSIELQEAA